MTPEIACTWLLGCTIDHVSACGDIIVIRAASVLTVDSADENLAP
jgi:hypothetical protein